MKKVLLVMLLAVAVFAVGCKKSDINQSGDAASASSGKNVSGTTANGNNYAAGVSSRGEYEASLNLKVVNFDFDKYDLTDTAVAILKANAVYLLATPGVKILVEGHTDDRGTVEYNLALGQRRADAVRNFYIQLGVAANRIATISFGKEKPVNPAANEEAWAANRRAETKLAVSAK